MTHPMTHCVHTSGAPKPGEYDVARCAPSDASPGTTSQAACVHVLSYVEHLGPSHASNPSKTPAGITHADVHVAEPHLHTSATNLLT